MGPRSTPSPLPAQPGGRGGILEKHLVREGGVGEGEEGADGPRAAVVAGGPGVQDGQTLFFWAPKLLQIVIAVMELKGTYFLEGKL